MSSTDAAQRRVLVLGAGFAVLVLLALLLCVIITFAPPLTMPSWPYRLSVVAIAVALVVISTYSVDGAHQTEVGLRDLTWALDDLRTRLTQVRSPQCDPLRTHAPGHVRAIGSP